MKDSWKLFLRGHSAELAFREFDLDPSELNADALLGRLQDLNKLSFSELSKQRFFTPPVFDENTDATAKRKKIWLQSRSALIEVVDALLSQGASAERMFLSLSHTSGACIAVAAMDISVGVDLEASTRIVSDGVANKYFFEEEKKWGWSALQVWAVKEAAYKANPENKNTVLSDYRIQSYGKIEVQDRALQFQVQAFDRWIVAFAREL